MNVLIKTSNGITQVPLETKQLSNRVISFNGKINEESALEFSDKILHLNLESREPITVLINSDGGEINSGLMMLDSIRGSLSPIRMVCRGRACSMAAILFACADERLMLPNSELMLHEPLLGGSISGNATSIKSISDSLMEVKTKMNRLLAERTGKTEDEVNAAISYDHFFSPEEAIDFKLCDAVISFSDIINFAEQVEG